MFYDKWVLSWLFLILHNDLINAEEDYNVIHRDGSYEFGHDSPDSFHHSQGTRNNIVRGKFGSRNPGTGAIDTTLYTAGPRGFRPKGKNVVRKYDLNQNGPRAIGSRDDPYYDPNEDPSYDFAFNTRTYNRQESANRAGDVTGKYSYLDDVGERHNVEFVAGKRTGFHVKTPFPDSNPRAYGPLYFRGRGKPIPRGRTSIQRGLDGSYRFISAGPDQRRTETSDATGHVRGSYTYLDDKGVQHSVHYIAGPETGYRVLKNVKGPHLPTIYPFGRPNIIPPDFYDYLTPDVNDVFDTAASGQGKPAKGGSSGKNDDGYDDDNGSNLSGSGGGNKGSSGSGYDGSGSSSRPGGLGGSKGSGGSGSGGAESGGGGTGGGDGGSERKPSYDGNGNDDYDNFDLFGGNNKPSKNNNKPQGGGSKGGEDDGSYKPTAGDGSYPDGGSTSSGSDPTGGEDDYGIFDGSGSGGSSKGDGSGIGGGSGGGSKGGSGGSGGGSHIGISSFDSDSGSDDGSNYYNKQGTIVTNVGDRVFAVPPGVSVRAHVQAIDLLPLKQRTRSPSEQLRAEVFDQAHAESSYVNKKEITFDDIFDFSTETTSTKPQKIEEDEKGKEEKSKKVL